MTEHRTIIPIDTIDMPELAVYAQASEPQLLHYYEPDEGLFIAESPMIIERALDAGYRAESVLAEGKYLEGAWRALFDRIGPVPVYTGPASVLSKITGYPLTRGLLCAMRRKKEKDPPEVCAGAKRLVILDNIENPTNIGAIFRSAAALGADGILLTPGSCDPLYRRAVRVSMGTVFQVPWAFMKAPGTDCSRADGGTDFAWPHPAAERLREQGFLMAAMALTENSLPLNDMRLREMLYADTGAVNTGQGMRKIAVVLGNEGEGLPAATVDVCDVAVKIPMKHGVDSLNVAAASAVAFWALFGSLD